MDNLHPAADAVNDALAIDWAARRGPWPAKCTHAPPAAVSRVPENVPVQPSAAEQAAADARWNAARAAEAAKAAPLAQAGARVSYLAKGQKVATDIEFEGNMIDIFEGRTPDEFTADDLPPALALYADLEAQRTGFDPTILLTCAVSVAAGAIADQIQITPYYGNDYYQQARLFAVMLGVSAASKSPAFNKMMKPLVDIQMEMLKAWRKAVDATPEGEDKPPRPVLVVNDTTTEALAKALLHNERGVIVTTDEFTGFFGSMDAYKSGGAGGKDRGEWLKAYDGGFKSIERSKDGGSIQVPNWSASILSCTTPAALGKIAKHLYADGFMQRFNVYYVQPQRIVRASSLSAEQQQATEDARRKYGKLIRGLFALVPASHGGVCAFAPDALVFFDDWRTRNNATQIVYDGLHPGYGSHRGKGPNFLLRIALTFHCVDVVANGVHPDPAQNLVSLATLKLAAQYVEKSFRHAEAFYLGELGASEALELSRRIGRHILAEGPQTFVKRRDFLRDIPAFAKAEEPLRASALRSLEELGWLVPVDVGYRKQGATTWAVDPRAWAMFADIAKGERERVTEAKKLMTSAFKARRQEKAAK